MKDEEQGRFRAWMLEEIEAWQREGLVADGLAATLRTRYAEGAESAARSRLISIFSTLGAILVGLGAILFVAAHWEGLERWSKVAILFGLLFGAYASGYELFLRSGSSPRVGAAFLLMGGLLYGANIGLIAQIFHLNAHSPNGILAWALGLLPLVYVAGSEPLLLLSIVLLAVWNGLELDYVHRLGGLRAWNPFFWVLLLGAALPAVRRFSSAAGMAGIALAGGSWLALAGISRAYEGPILYSLFGYGLLLLVVARWMRTQDTVWRALSGSLDHVGAKGTLAMSFFLCYPWACKELVRDIWHRTAVEGWIQFVPFVLAGAVAACAMVVAGRMQDRFERLACTGLAAIALLFALPFVTEVEDVTLAIVFNGIFLALSLGSVRLGVVEGQGDLVNTGLWAFGLWVAARYFQWFFDLLDMGLFFVIGGSVLLYGAIQMEKLRKSLQEKIQGGAHGP